VPETSVTLDPDMEVRQEIVVPDPAVPAIADASLTYTEDAVREYFSDIPIMAEVAWCESRFAHVDPATGEPLRGFMNSDDVGVMQINQHYHRDTAEKMGLVIENFEDNLAYARYLYDTQGTQPWSASMPCWGWKVERSHLAMN
jgi:hypothetical protein